MLTTLEALRACRDYAAQPGHIVCNPRNIWEHDDGTSADDSDAPRGCLIGIVNIVANRRDHDFDGSPVREALTRAAKEARGVDIGPCFEVVLERGPAAIVAVYDRAIEIEEARAQEFTVTPLAPVEDREACRSLTV